MFCLMASEGSVHGDKAAQFTRGREETDRMGDQLSPGFLLTIYPVSGLPVHGMILFPSRLGFPTLVNVLWKCLHRSTHSMP